MNNPLARDMIEATRLTQAGRLNEATALLQKLLRGERFPSTEPHAARAAFELPAPTIDVVAEIKDIADLEAFSAKEPPSGTDGIQKHAAIHDAEDGVVSSMQGPSDLTADAGGTLTEAARTHRCIGGFGRCRFLPRWSCPPKC